MKKIAVSVVCSVCLFLLFTGYVFAEPGNTIKDLFENKCSFCHGIIRPLSKIYDRDGWLSTVKRMQFKKPDHIKDEEAGKIVDYLTYIKGKESETINKVKNNFNLTEIEKLHLPVIEISNENKENKSAAITVKVGEIAHPMEERHYIKYIELFLDYKSVQKVSLNPGNKPEAVFEVKFAGNEHISTREECSAHGLWENSDRRILVEETIKASR